jgi:hypothetical protein
LLDAAHQRQGIDIFVASFSAVQKKDGAVVSYCVWGHGVDSLLPVTDKVAFMQHGWERPVALGDWARAMEVVGELMEQTADYPRRYRVREFPGRAALQRSVWARCNYGRATSQGKQIAFRPRVWISATTCRSPPRTPDRPLP